MKKNYRIVSVLLLALLFSIPSALLAQNANRDESTGKLYYQWYVNLNGGISQSFCDIQSGSWHLDQLQGDAIAPAFGLRLGKHISPVFGVYGSYMTGKLKGFNDERDLIFETDLWTDGILGVTVSLSNLFFGYKPRLINIYATAGIGLSNFTPTAKRKSTGVHMWDIYYNQGYNNGYNNWVYNPLEPDYTADDAGKDAGNLLANAKTEIKNTTETSYPTGVGIDFRNNNISF